MKILGSKFHTHDSALCFIDDESRTFFCVSTERVSRIKHDEAFIDAALPYVDSVDVFAHAFNKFDARHHIICATTVFLSRLEELKRRIYPPKYLSDVKGRDESDFLEKATHYPELVTPLLALKAEIESRYTPVDQFFNYSVYVAEITARLRAAGKVSDRFDLSDIAFHDHQLCHAVAAYYTPDLYGAPALIVTMDGHGDGLFSAVYLVDGARWDCLGQSPFLTFSGPAGTFGASPGELYSTVTAALGFRRLSDEGKVEALAAFGTPLPEVLDQMLAATDIFNNAIIYRDGIYPFLVEQTWRDLSEQHGRERVAATIQTYLETVMVRFIDSISGPIEGLPLGLSGGVAANIIMNLAIFENTRFKRIHVCPYMGDEGASVGAALLSALRHGRDVSWVAERAMPYLGIGYSSEAVEAELARRDGLSARYLGADWPEAAAQALHDEKIVGVFQGRAEFGPRALGNRSILGNPKDPALREKLNVSIKRRPPWQPFCPSILEEDRETVFQDSFHHKYMAIAFRVRPEVVDRIPSAVHVDGTARPQFVTAADNAPFHRLLTAFKRLNGLGVLINTSFNLHGRTIVNTPSDALDDFRDCNLDVLYMEGWEIRHAPPA